nr:MAG TPA: hypothetical protein [Caudoviricetes sp.]
MIPISVFDPFSVSKCSPFILFKYLFSVSIFVAY